MPEERKNTVQDAVSGSTASASRPRSRRLLRLGAIVVIVVALLSLLSFYAPRYIARHLIASELDELGIDYAGVETLNINPWTRELWLGPVRFGAGSSDQGQLGELGLTLRFNPLLQRRVSIERMLVRGIDVVVTRGKDNVLALNGVPLEQFMPPTGEPEQPVADGEAWSAGIDTLELRDSRLIFQDRERGDLEVDVQRLTLMEFQNWEPDRPGRFELTAKVNDVQLNWSGEARPFADNITLAIDSRTEQASVPRVLRFTGPLGWDLDRNNGSYDADLKYEITLFESGRVEGHTVGTIDIKGADYQRTGVFALALERAKLNLDVRYTLSESGDISLKGRVILDLDRYNDAFAGKTRSAVAAGRVSLTGLDMAYAKNGSLRFAVQPEIDLEGVEFSGPIELSVNQLVVWLTLLQSLSLPAAVSTADTGLGDFTDNTVVVPSSDVKVGRLRSKGERFSLQSADGQVEIGLKTSTDLFDIQIGVNEQVINIERLQSVLDRLSVTSGQGRLALEMAGSNSLVAGTAKGPKGEIKIGAFEAKMGKLGLQVQTGTVSLQLAAVSQQATGFSALLNAKQSVPALQFHLGAAGVALSQASLDVRGGALRWQAAGDASADALTADFAKGKEGAVKFGRAEIKALQANEQLLAADAITVDGLDLYLKRSLLEALLRDGGAGTEKVTPSEEAALKPSEAVATQTPEPAAQKVDVGQVQALLTELGYAPGPVDGRMGRRTTAAISEFQRREGLAVDGQPTGSLLAALQTRASGGPAAGGREPASIGIRLGHLALTGKPVIRFRDDLVKPQVNIDAVFKEARVRNLDTRKTDQRIELRVVADVNEFTHVELTGWAAGLGKTSDLDLNGKVENLVLSTYSPYVAELAGVYLESGQLDTAIAGKAAQGGLQGEIRIELDDIAFRPLSKADAERLTDRVGVPLETAVDLLQDGDGRIVLTLPVSGTLSQPDVDISSAVNKAIGGVLKKVFPPTMVASLLSGVAKGTGPAFDPIEFTPGSAELSEAGKSYADDVAEFLAERPKLSLRVCGRSTAQDMKRLMADTESAEGGKGEAGQSEAKPALDPAQATQALAELAVERKRTVRHYLIKEKGADVKRVRECRSTFDATDNGSPRVEISL